MSEKAIAFDFDSGEFKEESLGAVKPVKVSPKKEEEIEELEEQQDQVEEVKETVPQKEEEPVKKYKGIKVFRYGATDIKDQLSIDENIEYTDDDLIKQLNQAGYYEFKPQSTIFAFNEEQGMLAVTIRGNSKG
jgi:soluble cytochrome b562